MFFWTGMGGQNFETLTVVQTKICDFPYPISDLGKNQDPFQKTAKISTQISRLQLTRNGFHWRKHLTRATNLPMLRQKK